MHAHDLSPFAHSHSFDDAGAAGRSKALLSVALLTLLTMVAELIAGVWSGSLALLADGWHMGTHAAALGGAVLAHLLSRRAQRNPAYAFGGWKIEVLAAYTSGLLLMAVSAGLVADAVQRLLSPQEIAYREALAVALLGLAVNLLSAWMLARGARPAEPHEHEGHDHTHAHASHHAHHHAHGHHHGHHHGHAHDQNFSAAYLHVIADALTSVLAIAALTGGWLYGWRWLDPLVALLGAVVIARWAFDVLRLSARGLVDATGNPALRERVREAIEADGDAKLADLHVWQIGPRAHAAIVSVVADVPLSPMLYQQRLKPIEEIAHATVEVHRCPSANA